MKSLIYRNYAISFESAFIAAAMNLTGKLTFTTRDEYLIWVKQWKEDYKIVERQHKIDTLCYRRDHSIRPEKIAAYQKRLDGIDDPSDADKVRYNVLMNEYCANSGMPAWYKGGSYGLIIYMLVLRKAGKLRANTQRNLRILELAEAKK